MLEANTERRKALLSRTWSPGRHEESKLACIRPLVICPWLRPPQIVIFCFSPFKPYILIINCSFQNIQLCLLTCCLYLAIAHPSRLSSDVTSSSLNSSLSSLIIGSGAYPTCSHSPPLLATLNIVYCFPVSS